MCKSLVSIIIPTYNRAHLLGATLDSVMVQSYQNWECFVVDDGSSDATDDLMEFYCAKDNRIHFYHLPKKRRKGANACRNYGFELSKGEYLQWFDSDDLMVPEFLELKVKAIQENEVDFVISRAANFKDPVPSNIISENKEYYRFSKFKINHYNYVVQNVNWLTYDFLGKRELCEKVRFNEKLQSAQERNFFSKLTSLSIKAFILPEYLTLRRVHETSIQARFENNRQLKDREQLEFYYETWKDLLNSSNEASLLYLFDEAIKFTLRLRAPAYIIKGLTLGFIKKGELTAAYWYLIFQVSSRTFNKGYIFRRKFLNQYKVV